MIGHFHLGTELQIDQRAMEFIGVDLIYAQTDISGPVQLNVR
jgi:hypothetical protein